MNQEILEKFKDQYPSSEEAAKTEKEFPHTTKELTKAIITTKLKSVRGKYG